MRLELSPRAMRELARREQWWREHRIAAPQLFADEFRAALDRIRSAPERGTVFLAESGRTYHRVLMARTRCYVYYRIIAGDHVLIASLWSAVRLQPRL
ncbi:type II toxin-antitoxin system RelE/ParE family toxin [Pendulispora brunnea]|uniref:Type II toxin-antitoxin system RelE/ParE family toxin n=1 Tax=Pendulispora brunnea TaxID=2905690 RepID=A0ABZ2KGH4_9BACT